MIYYSDVSWDLSDVVFSPLLDKPESTRDHWDSCCFSFHGFSISILRSLYFGSFSTVFKEVFFFIRDRHINEQAGSLLLVFYYHVWPVCLDLFDCLDWHVPEYSHFIGKWSFLCSKKFWVPHTLLKVYCHLYMYVILTGFHSLTWLDVSVQLMSQILTSKHGWKELKLTRVC